MQEKRWLVFASKTDTRRLMGQTATNSTFLNIRFLDSTKTLGWFSNRYLFHLKDHFNQSYGQAMKIQSYLDYLDPAIDYQSERLNLLKQMRISLIDEGLYIPFDVDAYRSTKIYSCHKMPVPKVFGEPVIDWPNEAPLTNPVTLYRTKTQTDACLAVYETVVERIEAGIPLEQIVILNSTETDEYHLKKFFSDAGIPFDSQRKRSWLAYPEAMELRRLVIEEGFDTFYETIRQSSDSPVILAVKQLLNRYPNAELKRHPGLLIELLEGLTLTPPKRTQTIYSTPLEYTGDPDKHYLLMNFNDSQWPVYQTYHPYLTENEVAELGYFSLDEINRHLEEKAIAFIDTLPNLTLFFAQVTDRENREPSLDIHRPIVPIDYSYKVKPVSHFRTLDELSYAKAKFNLETYFLKQPDFPRLARTYQATVQRHPHEFSGIDQADLDRLIQRHNTLTGAKIESYHLCRFQYLLKYLLSFGERESTVSQFLGSLTHKVFETAISAGADKAMDLVAIHLDFPIEEKEKEPLFREALANELEKLLPLLLAFHQNSRFKEIETEVKFDLPLGDFRLTGIIDKAMVYDTGDGRYVVVVDYKIGDKDFNLETFQEGRMLQLPVYLYAYIQRSQKKTKPAGLFYQTTGIGRYKKEANAIEKSFMMKGAALNSATVMEAFDGDLSHVYGIRFKKDGGFVKTNRILDAADFHEMLGLVEKQIKDAAKDIKSGDFRINPLPSYGRYKDSVSCEYCEYAAICFNKNKGLGGEDR